MLPVITPPLLLVFEPAPALAPLLAGQAAGWRVETVAAIGALRPEAQAVLIDGPAGSLPADLRASGLIGPIFVLDTGEAAPGIIAFSRPLRLALLLAKLAQPNGAAIDGVRIGRWQVDTAQRALCIGERCERLTDREFDILKLLLEQRGQPLSREALLQAIWHYHPEADSHTVETHIWRLRQKLETDPAAPEHLVTEVEGYRLKIS
jgi:hypothetical protein